MTVVLVEAQLWVGAGGAVMPCVVLPVMVATAADARQMPIPVPDEFIECLLRLLDEVAEWLHRLAAFGLLRPLFFRLLALALYLFALCIFTGFSGLLFPDCAGALITADGLRVSHRMKPLAAFFVGALTAR